MCFLDDLKVGIGNQMLSDLLSWLSNLDNEKSYDNIFYIL